MKHLFHCGLAALLTHELDAMQQREWRLLYLLRTFEDDTAAILFVSLHFPLFAAIFHFAFHPHAALQRWSQRLLSAFFLLHASLHWRLMGDPLAPFNSALSLTLIHACALFGGLYLLIDWRQSALRTKELQ
jgi:hypothetical protein